MAGSLQWYRNSLLAWMWDPMAQQAIQSETPWFNMFANVNTSNVPWMDMLSPTERQNQEYDQNQMRVNALNKEVEIWLGSRIDNVMSDAEKQQYLNHLTKSQYEQMLKYKNEGYWFMASKELLENSYKLADPNATWLMKYKDYADKDAYYYNNQSHPMSDTWNKYVWGFTRKMANFWNETLGYWEDAEKGNMNFADRFANLTIWNIINWLDAYANAETRILDTVESWAKALYDKVVKGYDTDWDFYDRDREEKLVDEVIDAAYWAWQAAMWGMWLVPWALPVTAFLSTKPWEVLWGLTLGGISELVNFTLDHTPVAKQIYHSLSEDSQDKLSTWLAMVVLHKAGKTGKTKLDVKAEPYLNAAKSMIRNWLERGSEYAKVQADFEEFSKTKWWKEREDWTFVETENYNPWYRGRVAREFWEWFKEWVKEKFNNPEGTNLSEIESTQPQEWLQWWEKWSWAEGSNKTNIDNTQSDGIVNTMWISQLRQWNKMNKVNGIKFVNKYGTDYWTWMAERWFNQSFDNNINALWDYANYMQNQKSQALGTITQRYNEPAVTDMLADAIEKAEFIKSDDLNKLINLALKNKEGGLTPSDIDYVRQWFWYNFPLRFDWTDVSGVVQRNNNMYERVKNVLERIADENWLPQLRDINREIAATHHIIEWTTRYYNWLATNDIVSLKDLVTLAGTVANPKAWPLFVIQQAIKMPKVRDTILGKLIKGKTTEERNQIKIDFDKIKKIQDEAEQRRMIEEWIAKWNLKVEQATAAMRNRLPENISQWGVAAWDRGFMATYGNWPTYWELWLGNIRETYTPQYLLKAIIEQLKQSNLIKEVDIAKAIEHIMENLSPEAQEILARITQKLDRWWELTEQEWKVIEKIADIIRHDQEGLDNSEWTDINNTNLPTNPTNNGWENWGGTEWGIGWPQENWWMIPWWASDGWVVLTPNWWGVKGDVWKNMRGLWDSKGSVWLSDEVTEITNPTERIEILDSINKDWLESYQLKRDETNDESYRTIASKNKNVIMSIDEDWTISEFARAYEATPEDVKEVVLAWLDIWGDRVNSAPRWLATYLELLWFKFIAKSWNGLDTKYFMAHNWDSTDIVREKFEKYQKNRNLDKIRMLSVEDAIRYRDEFMDDNVWDLKSIKWWDWLKNYEDFDSKFTTEKQIKQYILDNFAEIKWNATPERKELYNELLAKSKEIYNWHISTKETNLRYLNKIGWWTTLWRWERHLIKITLWTMNGWTPAHEFTHNLDWKFWKELTWWNARLSEIVWYIVEYWLKRKENIWKKAELIWDFVDIYKDIVKRGRDRSQFSAWNKTYWTHPREEMARFWDAFVNFVKTWEPMSNYWEMYPKWLMVRYAEWLWKLDVLRVNWELDNWTLKLPYGLHDSRPLEIEWVWKVFVLIVDE